MHQNRYIYTHVCVLNLLNSRLMVLDYRTCINLWWDGFQTDPWITYSRDFWMQNIGFFGGLDSFFYLFANAIARVRKYKNGNFFSQKNNKWQFPIRDESGRERGGENALFFWNGNYVSTVHLVL